MITRFIIYGRIILRYIWTNWIDRNKYIFNNVKIYLKQKKQFQIA